MSNAPSLRGHHPKSYAMNAYLKREKEKNVKSMKKKAKALWNDSAEERTLHCTSAPSTKSLMWMNILCDLACQ